MLALGSAGGQEQPPHCPCDPLAYPVVPRSFTRPGSHWRQNHFLAKMEQSGQRRGAVGIIQRQLMNQGLLSAGWAEAATSARRSRDTRPGAVQIWGE